MSFWTLRLLCAAAALGLAGRLPAEQVLPLALACAALAAALLTARAWTAPAANARPDDQPLPSPLA